MLLRALRRFAAFCRSVATDCQAASDGLLLEASLSPRTLPSMIRSLLSCSSAMQRSALVRRDGLGFDGKFIQLKPFEQF